MTINIYLAPGHTQKNRKRKRAINFQFQRPPFCSTQFYMLAKKTHQFTQQSKNRESTPTTFRVNAISQQTCAQWRPGNHKALKFLGVSPAVSSVGGTDSDPSEESQHRLMHYSLILVFLLVIQDAINLP